MAVIVGYLLWETDKELERFFKEMNSGYTPEVFTSRHATEQECTQAGNRLLMQDSRYKYFCTEVKGK